MRKIILGTALVFFTVGSAFAQNSKPVWSTDYSNQDTPAKPAVKESAQIIQSPPPAPGPNYRQNRPPFQLGQKPRLNVGGADAAWARQWGPIQEVTGFSSGQAKQFIQGVKQGYIEGTAKTLSSAQDWAVILGSTGLVGAVTDSTTDWFKYVAHDVPSALGPGAGSSLGVGLMGGSGGFSSFPGSEGSQ